MTIQQQHQTIERALDVRGSELRMQALTHANTLKAMELHAMLEYFGADLQVKQSPAGFKTIVTNIRSWQEAHV